MNTQQITRDDIIKLFGERIDHRIVEILEVGANMEELEEASAWLLGESDVMGDARLPLTGRAAQICDILALEEKWARETGPEG